LTYGALTYAFFPSTYNISFYSYAKVEEMQVANRAEALAQVSALTAAAKAEGASIPMLLSGSNSSSSKSSKASVEGSSPMEQYAVWQKRIAETPYKDWELGQQVCVCTHMSFKG
jgi:hypothetical protein